ncbi:hypothetical protein E2C01_080234 [Portunus trituberculatus]|uniref:Uncharacterized protein n=1 Tax=Portunus trituberculatus TaxID=210409 RepID=A0A5B7IUV9_PORTR|nr:hypothetical protein [Portunus trituberculatus]
MLEIIMIVYQYVLLLCDFAVLLWRCLVLTLMSVWRTISPPPLASLAGEIVLVSLVWCGVVW